MPAPDALRVGHVYADAELEALDENRRPVPLVPYNYAAPAPRQGVGNTRRSAYGDKWCAYCQRPLARTWRGGACEPCRERREEVREAQRAGSPPPRVPGSPEASRQNYRDIQDLLDAVERLSQVVGVASAMRYRNGGMKPDDAEDMLVACKDVMVAADPLRRRLRGSQN